VQGEEGSENLEVNVGISCGRREQLGTGVQCLGEDKDCGRKVMGEKIKEILRQTHGRKKKKS